MKLLNRWVWVGILVAVFKMDVFGQSWGLSGSCNLNVNGPAWSSEYDNEKRAVFKFSYKDLAGKGWGCTGMLINQYVPEGSSIRRYFITARHCTVDADLNSFVFYFNYQSPDASNESVPDIKIMGNDTIFGNQGKSASSKEYRYMLKSPVRRIKEVWGPDISLMEIVNPIPAHFNVYYAGWSPRNPHPEVDNPYVGIHHPKGDIKKISMTFDVMPMRNPVATGCRTITKVIDAIIKLFGGKSTTEVVCNYVDIPYMAVRSWAEGITEPGSSGSPLFSTRKRLLTVLSRGVSAPSCTFFTFLTDGYGKFVTAYATPSFRWALNPSNVIDVNLFGIGGRQPTCPPDLELTGKFFPAKDYQRDNQIVLSTSGVANLHHFTMYPGSDLVVTGAQGVSTGVGFSVLSALFKSQTVRCSPDGYYSLTTGLEDWERYYVPTNYPHYFRAADASYDDDMVVFPNPTVDGKLVVAYEVRELGSVQLDVYTIHGKHIQNLFRVNDHQVGYTQQDVVLEGIGAGIYYMVLHTPTYTVHKKIIIDPR